MTPFQDAPAAALIALPPKLVRGITRSAPANMSFFADPWLFNCKNDADQRAIVAAISRASRYAQQHGVVMVAAQGNEAIDLAHPVTDTISPDFPPGSELTRDVGNNCVVLPNELPGVVGVTGVGPSGELSFFSSYGAGVTDVTAPSGSSGQAPNPFGAGARRVFIDRSAGRSPRA